MSRLKESQHLQIPFKEIESGTLNFQVCIGKGGFGKVYMGQLFISGKPTMVAVKRLSQQFGQGLKEFLTEIQLLTGQTHPNLISLIGYCDEGKEKIIVYEYAEHGSLDQYIRRINDANSTLTWSEKLKICVGAARGLDYLHNHFGQHQAIIHRDIKSSNILIDENWDGKISDLGLSKLSLSGLNKSAVVSHACGTPGYIEPEYMSTGIVKKESDVYSFGMVLFEVFCGRLCMVRDDDGFLLSGRLAKDYYESNKVEEIVDPRFREQMSPDSMNKFSRIAYRCLDDDRGQRPSMDLVLKELEESLEIQLSYDLEKEDQDKSCGESDITPSQEEVKKEKNSHISTEIIPCEAEMNVGFFEPLDTLKELTENLLDRNQEEVKVILDSKNYNWKNQDKFELVDEYVKNSLQTFDFCDALENCLISVQDIRMMIFVALDHFKEKRYVKTLENLKIIRDRIFTQDFLNTFQFMYQFVNTRQKVLVEKVQQNNIKLNNKLNHIQTCWILVGGLTFVSFGVASILISFSQFVSFGVASILVSFSQFFIILIAVATHIILAIYLTAKIREKEVIGSMQEGGFVGIKDLDSIKVLIDTVEMDVKDLRNKANYALCAVEGHNKEMMVKRGVEEMKENFDLFMYHVERLETHTRNYIGQIRRIRTPILQKIKGSLHLNSFDAKKMNTIDFE